jgi:3-isopropylmalate dehydrogenase
MMLRYSFHLNTEADCIEAAVASVLNTGNRTLDLAKSAQVAIGTAEMGRKIVSAIRERAQQAQPIAVH